MAIKFQYNKTSLGDLGKQLKMRQKALPTIKSKESALRSVTSCVLPMWNFRYRKSQVCVRRSCRT